jgi:predicted nucleotidyltransferase
MSKDVDERLDRLIAHFPEYVKAFDESPPFSDEQLQSHLHTIGLRRKTGTAAEACTDQDFLKALYSTLRLWRMDVRRAKLVPLEAFMKTFEHCRTHLSAFEGRRLDDPALNVDATATSLWDVISKLQISKSQAKLVSSTKALHHLLSDLVVPMDRKFTGAFFGWNNYAWQAAQEESFRTAFKHFVRVARATNPAQFVTTGWRSSLTKVIDNAIVGYCQKHYLDESSLLRLARQAAQTGSHQGTPRGRDLILETLEQRSQQIRRLGVKRLGLFGSAARGESTERSDLDFLVEFDHKSFDAYMDLKQFLEELFGCGVDLVLADSLKPRLRDAILNEAVHAPGL